MRILLFPKEFPSAGMPGAGIFVLRRALALRDLGHEVGVLRIVQHAPPIGAKWRSYRAVPAEEIVEGIPVRTIRAVFPPRMWGMEYLALQVHRAVAAHIRNFRPDVVNASFLIPNGQIAVRQDVPIVVTAHGSDAYAWPKKRAGLRRAAREAVERADEVTAVSGFIADRVRELYDRPVHVIWNGADEQRFYPRDRAAARESLRLPADRPVIAFAGNLVRAKGVYDLIDAVRELSEFRPLVVFAGAGPEAKALSVYAAQFGIDAQFAGRLEPLRIAELFAAADVVTLPSYNEGLPNVVCEAMLSGAAVVATTVGGIPEIVRDRESGLLVPAGDPHALSAALGLVLASAQLRDALGGAARHFAQAHLTWGISARGYDRVYRQALGAS